MSATLDEARAIVTRARTYMELEDAGPGGVRYGTRDHGDVGEEEASPVDVAEARRVKAAILAELNGRVIARVEVIDEWVTLFIEETR